MKEKEVEKQEMGPRNKCNQRKARSRGQDLVNLDTVSEGDRVNERRGKTELSWGGRIHKEGEQRPLSLSLSGSFFKAA